MTLAKATGDVVLLFQRSARQGRRDPGPAFVLPAMPPVLMVVVFTALFDRLVEVPGFKTDDYIEYLAPGAVILTALLGAGFTATYLVNDVLNGYLDRLRLLPAWLPSLVVGRVVFEAARVLPAAVVVLGLCVALGAPVENGLPGVLVAVALAGLLSASFAGLFYIAGLALRSPETALALQPIGVLVGFLSTALVPASIMPGLVGAVAEINPASVVVDGARAALNGTLLSVDLAAALGVCVLGLGLTQAITSRQLTASLARD